MTCAACGSDSDHTFCRECWSACPDPTREAFTTGQANVKRVAEMIRLRRQTLAQIRGGNRERRRGRESVQPHASQFSYRRK